MSVKLIRESILSVSGLVVFSVVGCSDDIVVSRRGPTEAQALVALQTTIAQGANIFAVPLPRSVTLASVRIASCESAKPQQGFRCMVDVITSDIPILGGFVTTTPIRFVETKPGEWIAFFN